MDELITIGLYGDGSRKARLRAEYVYCDHAKECSAFKAGKCFRVTTLFGVRCEYGRISRIDGATKQSKTYHRVYSDAKANERYGKLGYPHNIYVTRIGNDAFLCPPYINIEISGERLVCSDPGFGCNRIFVAQDILTPENIKRICDYRPHAMMGGEITDYQKKVVPMFLCQFSQLFPEQFASFTSAYPDYEIPAPDWIDRYALLSTCNRDAEYRDYHGNVFHFEGDEIVCSAYRSGFLPFEAKEVELRLKVTDTMKIKITNNNQVLADTVIV